MTMRARFTTLVATVLLAAGHAAAQPNAVHPALASIISTLPAGSWAHVNTTPLSSVWTPPDLRPLALGNNPPPSKVLQPWSSVGYDSRRGDILSYGGGHANYAGNDTYRWRSSTLTWERMSYPSDVQYAPTNSFLTMAIDGADHAPPSAHTYDNNIFLPLSNRLLVWGGAAFNTGSGFQKPDVAPDTYRLTGPYFFDPAKADPDKVGGSTGSHVKRVAPYPQILGGNMWENRDLLAHMTGQQMPLFLNGCTGLAQENGHDVVYVVGTENGTSQQNLYRYEVVNPANSTQDLFTKVGVYWSGVNGQTTCGYDPTSKLFVRTGSDTTKPFGYWDLTSPGTGNRDATVSINASITAFVNWLTSTGKSISTCALEYDPVRDQFPVWCGDGVVWVLKAPAVNGPTGWTITQQPNPTGQVPVLDTQIFGGVLGKWRYMPGYDVFVGVASIEGDVWVYKPATGWVAPASTDQAPVASITSPAANASLPVSSATTISVNASDPDGGTITLVRFYVNGVSIGDDTGGPWSKAWTPGAAGTYTLTAVATDDQGASTTTAPITVTAGSSNQPPTVSITSPADGAALAAGTPVTITANAGDVDGSVVSVQFRANGTLIATDSTGPTWSTTWTPSAGSYALTAIATDDAGATRTSATINVTAAASGGTTTVTLQRGVGGYAGVSDVTLSSYQYQDTVNWGARPDFREYFTNYTNLIRFAVFQAEGGPVPNGATIQSATLSIYHELYDYVYELRPMLKPWGELTATWKGPTGGTSAWSAPGAYGAGTDYSTTPDASVAAPWNGGFIDFDVTARVRSYGAGGANYGWRMLGINGTTQLRWFRSSEYTTDPSTRPKLVVTYSTGAPTLPTITIADASTTGTVSDASITSVLVNGVSTPVSNGRFSLPLALGVGTRTYTIQATNAAGTATRTVTVTVQ